jgi:hypothetical protein
MPGVRHVAVDELNGTAAATVSVDDGQVTPGATTGAVTNADPAVHGHVN